MSVAPVFSDGDSPIFERAGAKVTLTSLVITKPDVSYETFEELCVFIGTVHRASSWWMGDTLNQIEMRYGDLVYQAAEHLGVSPQTVKNVMSICERVPRSRRRENVHFSTHAEVAALEPEQQKDWLQKAEQNGWTKNDLRREIQGLEQPAMEVHCVCQVCGNIHYTVLSE